MKTRAWLLMVLSGATVLALAACGDDDGGGTPPPPSGDTGPMVPDPPDLGTPPGDDAGAPPADAGGGEPDAGVPACTAPPPPYGTRLSARMEPFTLPDCDGNDYSFYNEEWCASTLTVVSIAAGWCPPCIAESRQLTRRVTDVYRDRGVRVIQVLVQDESYREPSAEFCHGWVDTYGLTNIELRDAYGVMQIYFPDGVLPDTMIVDREGIIQFREHGATDGLTTLTAALDRLLAGR